MASDILSAVGSGTYTVPAGVTSIVVDCFGAGGTARNNTDWRGAQGRGGGGGGWGRKIFTVTPGQTFTYSIAGGGTTSSTTFSTLSAAPGLHGTLHGYGGGYSGADVGASGTQGVDYGGAGGNSGGYPIYGGAPGATLGAGSQPGGGGSNYTSPAGIGGAGMVVITYADAPPVATIAGAIAGPVVYGSGNEVEVTDASSVATMLTSLAGPSVSIRAGHKNLTLQEHLVATSQTVLSSYTCPLTGAVGPAWTMAWVGQTGGWTVDYIDGGYFVETMNQYARALTLLATELTWSDSNEMANTMRAQRNQLLLESDRTQLMDADLSEAKREAWAQYRRALRNLPQQYPNPANAVWPPKPG